jgi:hypothetical protein
LSSRAIDDGATPENFPLVSSVFRECRNGRRIKMGMRLSRYVQILSAAALLLSATTVLAADKTSVVKFASGATSATIKGSVKGYDMNTYVLGANAGQTLSVTFKPNNGSCYYNIDGPDGGEALFNGSMSSDDYSGALPADGDYRIGAYLMRNAARRNETCKFSITFEIKD